MSLRFFTLSIIGFFIISSSVSQVARSQSTPASGSETAVNEPNPCSGTRATGSVDFSKVTKIFFQDPWSQNTPAAMIIVGTGKAPDGSSHQQVSAYFRLTSKDSAGCVGTAPVCALEKRRSTINLNCIDAAKQALATGFPLSIYDTVAAGSLERPSSASLKMSPQSSVGGCGVEFQAEGNLLPVGGCQIFRP